jgi:hypothetical protein
MKRRNFLSLISASALLGTTFKGYSDSLSNKEDVKCIQFLYKESFYEFFKWFNGFNISKFQCLLYFQYINKVESLTLPRQCGASTLLLTLAAWSSMAGDEFRRYTPDIYKLTSDKYYVIVSNKASLKNMQQHLKEREEVLNMTFRIKFLTEDDSLSLDNFNCVFFDCVEPPKKLIGYGTKTFTLKTTEV